MQSVPQEKYDKAYYISNCDGYTPDGVPGKRLEYLINTINSFLPKELSSLNVFDIGCGRGELSKYYAKLGHNILSLDYSYASMKIFEENVGDTITFIRHDIVKGMRWMINDHFDVIIMADILEHIHHENMINVGRDIVRISKKNGLIFIDTPILKDAWSEMHVNVKTEIKDVVDYFPGTKLLNSSWYLYPNHCNITLQKN